VVDFLSDFEGQDSRSGLINRTLTRAACGGLSSPAYEAGEGVRKRLARFLHKLSE